MVSSDRGPEVRNALIRELCAVLGISKLEGLPRVPIYQAQVERDHLGSKLTLTCILDGLAAAFPAEWEFYVPPLEYLKYITPYGGDTDLTPRDLDHGWSLAADMDKH